MSRRVEPFQARLFDLRHLPLSLRVAALGEALAACSPSESEAIALELLELAVLPAFVPSAEPVRALRALSFIKRLWAQHESRKSAIPLAEICRRWAFIPGAVLPAALSTGRGRWHEVVPPAATYPSQATRPSLP